MPHQEFHNCKPTAPAFHRRLFGILAWSAMVTISVLMPVAVFVAASEAQEVSAPSDSVVQRTRPAGIRRFRPNAWGVAGVEVVNHRDAPVEVVSGIYLDGDAMTQYSRRVWLPGNSRRITWIPLRLPDASGTELRARRFLQTDDDGALSLVRGANEMLFEAETLTPSRPPVTVVIDDWYTDDPESLAESKELAITMRLTGRYTRVVTEVNADDVPAFQKGLDAVDHIVLAGNQIAELPAALATIRNWLHDGGRLWVLLDQVEMRTVERLLGDATAFAKVDRVRLTDVQFFNRLKNQKCGDLQTYDDPVDFVRVIVEGAEVTHEVNGWPAAFRQGVGHGRVMFTTLSAAAWMRRRRPDEWVEDMERNGTFIAVQALDEVTDYLTRPLAPSPLEGSDFEALLSEDIGYRIPARGTVMAVMAVFWVGLVASGFWLLRNSRLERLALAGPLMACAAAAPLVILGERARTAVPPAAATAELVSVGPGSSSIHSNGVVGVFVPEPTAADVRSENGRLLVPDTDASTSAVRRMMWTDADAWQWENVTLPTGLQFLSTQQDEDVTIPIRATATFGPDGIIGTLQSGAHGAPSDMLIATTAQHALAVHVDADGSFRGGEADLREPGVYVTDALLSDKQRRRQKIYQKLLLPGPESRFPAQPTLLAWTQPADAGLHFPDGMRTSHAALLAVPLELHAPAAETDVFIPSPFLTFETIATADGTKSTAYDERTGQWQKTSYPTVSMLQFQIPPPLLPLKITRGEVFFGIRAPGRTLVLATGSMSEPTPLESLDNPVGAYRLEIQNPAGLQLGENGSLHVRLDVSDLHLEESDDIDLQEIDRSWMLDYIRLQLHGRTSDATAFTQPGPAKANE